MEKEFKKWGYVIAICLILILTAVYFISHFKNGEQTVVDISSNKNSTTLKGGSTGETKALQSMVVSVGGEVMVVDGDIFSIKNEDVSNGELKVVKIKITGKVTKYDGTYNKQGGFDEKGSKELGATEIKVGERASVTLVEPVGIIELYNNILPSAATTVMPAMPAGNKPL